MLVKDIRPNWGAFGVPNSSTPADLTNFGGTLYFSAHSGYRAGFEGNPDATGRELWKSDGTTAGTVLVKNIADEPGFLQTNSSNPDHLVVVNATLFFTADNGIDGEELWKSDGTAAGTELVKDIHVGYRGSESSGLTDVGGTLFFTANDGENGRELWRSDGAASNTVLVADVYPGDVEFEILGEGREIVGKVLERASSAPFGLTDSNGVLFFSADDGLHGRELWTSDGTGAGTAIVQDINVLTLGSTPRSVWPDDRPFFSLGETTAFRADDGVHGNELWGTDGTAGGAELIKDIFPGPGSSDVSHPTDFNSTTLFAATDYLHGHELWTSDGTETGTTLVKDVNPVTPSSFPEVNNWSNWSIEIDGITFFASDDGMHGLELWKTDGTAEGTVLVKDINQGPDGALVGSGNTWHADLNGTLFFIAADGLHGSELWKSDGTEAGTVMVKDIDLGTDSSLPKGLTVFNGTLFFSAWNEQYGRELWKSDGTETGTVMVKDIWHGGESWANSSAPGGLTVVAGTLFFTAADGLRGYELWKSDGTEAGTVFVKDINPDQSYAFGPRDLVNVGGTLLFVAVDDVYGYELWKSDGTQAGTTLVRDINPGDVGARPGDLTVVDATLFFTADDGTHGEELWKSDGTPAGTVLVKDVEPGSGDAFLNVGSNLTDIDGTLFFTSRGHAEIAPFTGSFRPEGVLADFDTELPNGTWTLEITDGPPGDTGTLVNWSLTLTTTTQPQSQTIQSTDVPKAIDDRSTVASDLEVSGLGGTLTDIDIALTINHTYDWEVGAFLISPSGTRVELFDEVGSSGDNFIDTTLDDEAARRISGMGVELWKSDGTEGGTVLVKEFQRLSSAAGLVNVDGTLFFACDDGISGLELWKSDGTPEGTVPIKDIHPGETTTFAEFQGSWITVNSSFLGVLAVVDGALLFIADDGIHGRELWKSDGTEPGTVLVKDIRARNSSANPEHFTVVDDSLFFVAEHDVSGRELWKTDGTAEGTVLVKDILVGQTESFDYNTDTYMTTANGSSPDLLTEVDGALFFVANAGEIGRELWTSDGTPQGTVLVKDIMPGEPQYGTFASANPRDLMNVNGTLFFTADDGVHGRELWKTDGTPEGTIMLKDIGPGDAGFIPYGAAANLTNVNGTLFFGGDDGAHGYELWKTDGTEPGTVMVKDINPNGGIWFDDPVAVNDTLFFTAEDSLWKSDGTELGTVIVKQGIRPGNTKNVNGTLFFTSDVYAPFTGSFRPEGVLADFDTESPNGTWMLEVTDIGLFSGHTGTLGNWSLTLTTSGGTQTIVSTDVPKPIPDLSTVTSDLNVSGLSGALIDVDVTLNITHTYDSELDVFLISPLGTRVELFTGVGEGGDDFVDTALDDEAVVSIATGTELWKSDGTAAGTVLLKDINPGDGSSYPRGLTAVGSMLFFSADDGLDGHGRELWMSDGTQAGTVLVADLNPGGYSSSPSGILNVAGNLFFRASNGFTGEEPRLLELQSNGVVVGRHVFYESSARDGSVGASPQDDTAIAPDKTALLPGQTATFANYTSYSRGINGLMIDVTALPAAPTADDFEFHTGNNNDPAGWTKLDVEPTVTLRPGAGVGGSDRVTIVLPDGTAANAWLQVTVKAGNLGLPADDVFYFGNAVAETGNSPGDAAVTTTDLLLARNNPRSLIASPAGITFPYDYDRDGQVNATDVLLARNNQTSFFNALKLIDLAVAEEAASLAELAWLAEARLDQPDAADRTADAQDAVDVLLATYWGEK